MQAAIGQVSDNKSLNGKYFFRHSQYITDGTGTLTEARSGSGTMTFDGNGNLTFTGTQIVGATAPASLTGSGTYAVKSGGFVTLTNPLKTSVTVNARVSTGAVLGSSTESGTTLYDLFVAIAAPAQPLTTATLTGNYYISSLEFPTGSLALVRDTFFTASANGSGGFGNVNVTGEAANLGSKSITQSVTAASYTVAADGSGTVTFPFGGGTDSSSQLIGGAKTIYVSQDGSYFIGGGLTTGDHGLVFGIRAYASGATNGSFNGLFWGAGLRIDSNALSSFAGAASAQGTGNLVWSRRLRQQDALIDFTPLTPYKLTADGSGTVGTAVLNKVALAATGKSFLESGVSTSDTTTYEIVIALPAAPQSGTGVFLNPQGVLNAGSYAPAGNPLAPGEFFALFGTGFVSQQTVAGALPFPTTLGGVQVTINNTPAPLYFVSANQISGLVPYSVTGSTATVVVTSGANKSNTVSVPLAASSPGVFTVTANGLGGGAILHADYTLVSSASPAKRGEVVQLFLTGLGAVTPAVADGSAAPSNPLSLVPTPLAVYVGGSRAPLVFQGLAPGLAGLYQINFTIPSDAPSGNAALAVQTLEAFTDLADIAVQ